jgi:peptidyl-prolyl cis-trans isomerase B (cyclophilin B)
MKKIMILLLLLIFVVGCTAEVAEEEEQLFSSEVVDEEEEEMSQVKVETNKGDFVIELYEDTPLSTANFLKLVGEGFYDGLTFHRFETGFVIQGGDPSGDGTGGSADKVDLEVIGKSHSRGTLGMARSNDPNSASSQFFVNLADNTFLDDGYTVFGNVIEGMDVVDSLRAGDTMNKVSLI